MLAASPKTTCHQGLGSTSIADYELLLVSPAPPDSFLFSAAVWGNSGTSVGHNGSSLQFLNAGTKNKPDLPRHD